jgi:hypothetical protein
MMLMFVVIFHADYHRLRGILALKSLSNITAIKLFLAAVYVSMPNLCCANEFSGAAGRAALLARIKANPDIVQQAKQFMLANSPEIAQSPQRLPYNGKARGSIGQARGVALRNLRPLDGRMNEVAELDDSDPDNDVSITPGREFAPQALWNSWIDAYYFDFRDRRYNLDFDGRDSLVVVGTDRLLQPNLAVGLLVSFQNGHTTGFDDNWITNSNQITVGPYLGYQFSPTWALNASLGYGNSTNNVDIANFNGSYIAQSGSFEVDMIGQYAYQDLHLRIKPALFYSYIYTNAYQMSGNLAGINLNIPVPNDNFSLGLVAISFEINRDFKLKTFKVLEPFADIGVLYAFERPNNGKILTGNLSVASTSPWSGSVRLGARVMVSKSLYVSANGGYLSIGQAELNIWEARLYLSYAF